MAKLQDTNALPDWHTMQTRECAFGPITSKDAENSKSQKVSCVPIRPKSINQDTTPVTHIPRIAENSTFASNQ